MPTPPAAPLKIRVRYFASVRERVQLADENLVTSATTVAALRAELAARSPVWQEAFESNSLRCARNLVLLKHWETPLADGDEIGFFPPVTGG